jgi:snurportin-1
VVPRPEGKRVIVLAENSHTLSRTMNGAITYKWQSNLPGGSSVSSLIAKDVVSTAKSKAERACTILDCIYHELDKTFYVLDMMCWNGYRCVRYANCMTINACLQPKFDAVSGQQ